MKKSIFVLILVAALAGVTWFASTKFSPKKEAVQAIKMGILYKGNNFQKVVDGFVEGLNETFPKNTHIEYIIKNETGTEQKDFDATMRGIVDSKVDIIIALGAEPVLAAKKATAENKIPVIFGLGSNPTTLGVIESFQRPGGNMTGVTWQVGELSGKRLEFLKMIAPQIKRVTIFRKKENKVMDASFGYLNPTAGNLGVTATTKEFSTLEEFQKVVLATSARDTDAIYYMPDPFVSRNGDLIIKHSLEQKLPTMFADEFFVTRGGLASYGANFFDAGKQSSRLVAKILIDKQSPSEIPVETVTKVDFVINLATAKTIGLPISDEVLSLAQTVIKE